jgi:hypothetical protein
MPGRCRRRRNADDFHAVNPGFELREDHLGDLVAGGPGRVEDVGDFHICSIG